MLVCFLSAIKLEVASFVGAVALAKGTSSSNANGERQIYLPLLCFWVFQAPSVLPSCYQALILACPSSSSH